MALCAGLLTACGDKGSSAASTANSSSQTVSGSLPGTTSGTTGTSSGTTSGTTTSGTTGTPTTTTASVIGSATLSWTPPLQNTDGSMLTDLAGYHVYYGTDLSALNKVVTLPSASQVWYIVQNLTAGTWYFTVRAYNSAGVESDFSQSASKTI
jgi:hypothetical protein